MAEHLKSLRSNTLFQHLFAAVSGIFVSLSLLKFGTPVILDHKVIPPADLAEVIFQGWPLNWGYLFLFMYAATALLVSRWAVPKPRWPLIMLFAWLAWQFLSAADTVDSQLSVATLKHFTAATICFGIGYFALSQIRDLRLLRIFILLGFIVILRVGLEQHFGGFENTRQYFFLYVLPTLPDRPEEYIQKISSNRIFSTLFYPNSFAGALLLFLPIAMYSSWEITRKFGRLPQIAVGGTIFGVALACLYWSGSKSGWLILLVIGLVFLIHTNLRRSYKIGLIAAFFLLGAVGFTLKYSAFFEKGATSVVARFDYWRAAVQIFKANPVLGSGPGTFSRKYALIKSPDSEMARLTHNDYLEQACDSGLIGFVTFSTFIIGSLAYLYRYRIQKPLSFEFIVWLGILGLCLQSFSEFNLYIPALSWPMFLLLGWLWAADKQHSLV